MASGVKVNDNVVTEFQKLKTGKQYRFITFKLSDDLKEIDVDQCVTRGADNETDFAAMSDIFKAAMDASECRYAVFDVDYDLGDAGLRNKICFFLWAPDGAKIRQRMVYSSSKDNLKKKIGSESISHDVQANDLSDLDLDELIDTLSKGKAVKKN